MLYYIISFCIILYYIIYIYKHLYVYLYIFYIYNGSLMSSLERVKLVAEKQKIDNDNCLSRNQSRLLVFSYL